MPGNERGALSDYIMIHMHYVKPGLEPVHATTRHSTGNMIRVPASVAFSTYGMNPVFSK